MLSNVAFFGPAHDGKSTLVGYMLTQNPQSKLEEDEFNRIVESHKKRAGDDYDDSRIFGYFVDTGKSEIKRVNEKNSTTKSLHFYEMKYNEASVVLIDTPGVNKKQHEQYKGVFLADIGVFVIDINKIQKLLLMRADYSLSNRYRFEINAYFSPLFLWGQTRSYEDVIFVMSKYDSFDSSVNNDLIRFLSEAKRFIEGLLDASTITIVPTYVDVDNRLGHNIFSKSIESSDTMSLIEALINIRKTKNIQQRKSNLADRLGEFRNSSFAFIDRKFGERIGKKDKNRRHPQALRIKAVNNDFCIEDEIQFGPVQDRTVIKSEREFFFCYAKIDSIMIDGSRERSNCLREGQIGGIVLNHVYTENERQIDLKDIEVSRTSVVASKRVRFRHGNIIYMKINVNDWAKHWLNQYDFYDLRLNHHMDIHWGGKTVFCILVGKKIEGDDCLIQVYLPFHSISFPENQDILPDGNVLSIIKRYSKDKFISEKAHREFEPVVFLKSRVLDLKIIDNGDELRYNVFSCNDKIDMIAYISDTYNLEVSRLDDKTYFGKIKTNSKKIRRDVKKLSDLYSDISGNIDTSEISVEFVTSSK